MTNLMDLQQKQEKYRLSNTTYSSAIPIPGVGGTATGDYYDFSVASGSATATAYTLQASAKGSQLSDTGCTTLSLSQSGDHPSGDDDCWKK